ncbi:MAG: formylglycine-generating enzyme family protein [Desulfobacteraceae bacterium]|nr:MAG: formylglycine-generating enzyme family protein [Desulfobacteraceae bacterium]
MIDSRRQTRASDPVLWIIFLIILTTGAKSLQAETLPQQLTNRYGMTFVLIPPGSFMMGSPAEEYQRAENEKQHKVTLTKGFYLQTTEVTQEQWKKIMGYDPSKFNGCPNCPVESISWNESRAFIQKLNKMERANPYRLPTEAEWEYACRADTTSPFYVGKYLSTDQANYNGNHPIPGSPRGINRNRTIPVGSFPANPFGLYDMHGNVYEWCQDWYGEYPAGPVIDPIGPPSGYSRISRGGGMSSYARRCRSANRTKHLPDYVNFYIGLRLARSL